MLTVMLFFRCTSTLALATILSCGAGGSLPRDATYYDVPASRDVVFDGLSAPADVFETTVPDTVGPTVDVIAFDASFTDAGVSDVAFDAGVNPATTCAMLSDAYAMAVRSAQQCTTAADCSAVICETLCCQCQVYANVDTRTQALLDSFQSMWSATNCATSGLCVAQFCAAPSAAECTSAGLCTTFRRAD